MWTIYCHTHVESGRRYVGLTRSTMMKRWAYHVYDARKAGGRRSHFHHAIRKHGASAFSHEVLETCSDLQVANLAEECWIDLFDTRNPEKGFNLMRGGGHTPHPLKNPWDRPEYRAKVIHSRARLYTPDYRERLSAALRNRKVTDNPWDRPEYREKVTQSRKSQWTPEYRERMSAIQREAAQLRRRNADERPVTS
jgi:hypothetical protein